MKADGEQDPAMLAPPGVERNTVGGMGDARRRASKAADDAGVSPTVSQYAKREERIRWQKSVDDAMLLVKILVAFSLAATWIGLTVWQLVVLRNEALANNAPVIIWKPSANNSEVPDCSFTYDAAYGDYQRLEQPWNKPYIGFSIDWSKDTAAQIEARMEHRPMMIGAWIHISNETWERDMVAWYASELKKQAQEGGKRISASMLQIALMPDNALDQIPDRIWRGFAEQMRDVNYVFGIPVFLRFAHEMNGNWNPYGQRPLAFVRTFRKLSGFIRSVTNLTALAWAPNMGAGYPYSPSIYTPANTSAEWRALDTNKDGKVDEQDDPYTPYWPGEQYVDWVAMSNYWFGDTWPEIVNKVTPPGYFESVIFGNSTLSQLYGQPQWDFYAMFAERYRKPLAVPESGAVFYSGVPPGPGELALKQSWWRQSFNAEMFRRMPRLKMVSHFEEAKVEERGNASYLITYDPIREHFMRDFPMDSVTFAEDVRYSCDGKIWAYTNPAKRGS
ncbi:glycoside hydrolase superfamily [Hyaloraphidium curvatum]|nr:glycoside hydrolase superfamily [Hyaloraphidium curvatum]